MKLSQKPLLYRIILTDYPNFTFGLCLCTTSTQIHVHCTYIKKFKTYIDRLGIHPIDKADGISPTLLAFLLVQKSEEYMLRYYRT
jgi:hypothetical protein